MKNCALVELNCNEPSGADSDTSTMMPPTADRASLRRFLAPYYALNSIAVLSYIGVRHMFWNAELEKREGFLNIPRVRVLHKIAWTWYNMLTNERAY
jgi:hypothetical protein